MIVRDSRDDAGLRNDFFLALIPPKDVGFSL